jgi:hypothetical protein
MPNAPVAEGDSRFSRRPGFLEGARLKMTSALFVVVVGTVVVAFAALALLAVRA